MKFMHLSDLHIGKRVNEISLLEDQKYMLERILDIADAEAPQAVLIAGDVYDKAIPSGEAVGLFDDFLFSLTRRGLTALIISGNHDSAERLAFGGRLLNRSGVFLSPVYDGGITPVTLSDDYGTVNFWLLPFVKPAHVRAALPEQADSISSYSDALREALSTLALDTHTRQVLITHQFVTGADRCDSEDVSVGGADNVDAEVFDSFDYVALGHLHGPQSVGRESIRYCGSPLKYSFSEELQEKSVTIVEMAEKGQTTIRAIPLLPLHDMRTIRGSYEELTLRENYIGTRTDDYLRVILTDEQDIPNAVGCLRVIYPNLMKLEYDNTRTRTEASITGAEDAEQKSPLQLLAELYEQQNGTPMSEDQLAFSRTLFESIEEGMR